MINAQCHNFEAQEILQAMHLPYSASHCSCGKNFLTNETIKLDKELDRPLYIALNSPEQLYNDD